ncbi:MAG: prenyltransferase [Candidatus Omnitrophota bacterium]|nr:prenyltransferase [Candidatus Omnitrophota bacterium]
MAHHENRTTPGITAYLRALRLPFATASIFPFLAGSFLPHSAFRGIKCMLGLGAALFTHLAANLINDYADSKSGADWQDVNFYKFFGGSKLIQEGVFSEKFYLRFAIACGSFATLCVILLAVLLSNASIVIFYGIIVFLGFSYSHKPLQFSYRRMGEFIIFILFGPTLVMGGYFIQTGKFPAIESFLVSLPFAFFTTAILFSNEIPDYETDIKVKKFTWVSITGKSSAFILYGVLMAAGFISIASNIARGNLSLISLCSYLALVPAVKAFSILKGHYNDKVQLMRSSQLTIGVQVLTSIIMIIDIIKGQVHLIY